MIRVDERVFTRGIHSNRKSFFGQENSFPLSSGSELWTRGWSLVQVRSRPRSLGTRRQESKFSRAALTGHLDMYILTLKAEIAGRQPN